MENNALRIGMSGNSAPQPKLKIPRVKICCILTLEEAQLAIAAGAWALGFVSEMPSGPGIITEEKIAEIAAAIPPEMNSFLLTSKTDASDIIAQQRRCQVKTIQFCDRVEKRVFRKLRPALPGIALVQVVHVSDHSALAEALAIAPELDAILLDSGNPDSPQKTLGGTGRIHNWSVSLLIRQTLEIPVLLAGGLTPQNVAEAVQTVQPYAVDVCSGVRTDGKLDPAKLSDFFQAARNASPIVSNEKI